MPFFSVDARATASPLHVAPNSVVPGVVSFAFPTGRRGYHRVGRPGGRSIFSVGWRGTGADCCALSRVATRTRQLVVQRWSGDTFHPPGGS